MTEVAVSSAFDSRWTLLAAKLGAVTWVILLVVWRSGKAPIGIIDLLFLLAPLVVVPLGFEVLDAYAGDTQRSRVGRFVRLLQPLAAGLAVASFLFPTGMFAGVLSTGWLIVGGLTGCRALADVVHGGWRTVERVILNVARFDLALASCWFLVSRWGIMSLGFAEPIVLLTAVHFHYAGFATATIAGAALHDVAGQSRSRPQIAPWIVVSVAFLPYLLAAGFVFSASLRLLAGLLLASGLLAFAVIQFSVAARLGSGIARAVLRLSAALLVPGMLLAVVYTVGEYSGRYWLIIPAMARIHGALNGPGFVLLGLLAWLTEHSHRMRALHQAEQESRLSLYRISI
jgi:YndJ-like protein